MRVLVTGAGGLTAGAVIERLARAGHDVIGVGHRPQTALGKAVAGDCRDPELMTPLLGDVDALVHVAGIVHGPPLARIDALRSPDRMVVVSSAAARSRHTTSASAYLEGEAAIARVRPDVTFVRPTMIYGSARDRNVHHLIDLAGRWGFLLLVGPGDRLVQPIHFEDLAEGLAGLVERPAPRVTFDAGGADALTVRTMFGLILKAVGRADRVISVPRGIALPLARSFDHWRGTRWTERIERLDEDRSVDNTDFLRLTAVRPRTFEEGIREQIREMRFPRRDR